jgi:hypothetical protein
MNPLENLSDTATGTNLEVLEAALHSLVLARCQHAYAHDMRDGLQSLYSSVDILQRCLTPGSAQKMSVEKTLEFTRHTLKTYDQALEQWLIAVVGQSHAAAPLDLGKLARQTVRFVNNDAISRGVRLMLATSGEHFVNLPLHQARLTFLSLLVCSIDRLISGDELRFTITPRSQAMVEVHLEECWVDQSDATLPAAMQRGTSTSLLQTLTLPVIQQRIHQQGGSLECTATPHQPRVLSLLYPLG